jgi:O-antigen/teichoic acid export membrane protein
MGGYALAASLGQVVFVAAVLEFVEGPKDVGRAPLCYLAGEAMAAMLLLIQFVRRFGLSPPLRDRAWLVSLGEGLPFLVSRLVRTIGVTFDVFALKLYLGDTAVGLYGAASRVALSVLGVAVLYFVNVTPAFARVALTEPAWLQSLFTKSLRLSAIAAVPIGIGGAIVAPAIVTMLFGPAYAGAGTALRLLLLGVSVTLVSQNYRILLVASSHQRAEMAIVSASAGLTIILNVLLVPQLGLAGAGIAFLASEMLLLALGLGAVRLLVGMQHGLRHLVRPLAASIIMAVVLLATTSVPLVARLSVAALAYGAAILALRGTTLGELRDLFLVRRHLHPVPGGE